MNKSQLSVFILTLAVGIIFSACEKMTIEDDLQLIEAIETAEGKTEINLSNLPSEAQAIISEAYSESYTEEVLLAEKMGYQIEMRRGTGSRLGERVRVLFDLEGRELFRDGRDRDQVSDRRTNDGRDVRECFRLVYPITIIMPDGTTITQRSEEELIRAMRRWYAANPRTDQRPQLQYPVTVEFPPNDRTTTTTVIVNNDDEMERVRQRCD